jgi:outer membrane protein assembly factor BamB
MTFGRLGSMSGRDALSVIRMRRSREVVVVVVLAIVALAAMIAVYEHPWLHHAGRLAAFNLRTGAVRFDVPAPTASVQVHAKAAGAIVLSGADDCSGVSSGELWAVDHRSGETLWSHTYREACGDYGPVDDPRLGPFVAWSSKAVQAFATSTGDRLWTAPVRSNRPIDSEDAIVAPVSWRSELKFLSPANGRVVRIVHTGGPAYPVGLARGIGLFRIGATRLAAFNLHTGRRMWSVGIPFSVAAFQIDGSRDGTVVVSTATAGHPSDGSPINEATAFDVTTGRRLWRITARSAKTFGLAASGAGIALFGGAGTIVARDLRDGHVRWTRSWPKWTGDVGSEAVAGNGTAVVVERGRLTALDAHTGGIRWSRAIRTEHVGGHWPGLIQGNTVYVPTVSTGFKGSSD